MATFNFFPFKNEITDSVADGVQSRVVTPIYGTFAILWLIFHWNFVYSMFFVGEQYIYDKTGMLRNEYLFHILFNFQNWYFYVSWIAPFILTWLVIWKFPKLILLPAVEKEEEYRASKIVKRLKAEKDIKTYEKNVVKVEEEKLELEEKKAEHQAQISQLNPQILWEQEFLDFTFHPLFLKMKQIVTSLYEHNGKTHAWGGTANYRIVDADIVAYLHTKGVLDLSGNNKGDEEISLTEKGRYFISQYLEKFSK